MRRITIERNKNAEELQCAGNISGETDDGRRWIMFLDVDGVPEIFWPDRDEDGGVRGDPKVLWQSTGPRVPPEDHDPSAWSMTEVSGESIVQPGD
jgi:hypothetical protein